LQVMRRLLRKEIEEVAAEWGGASG
jgi:hypothetical protein